MIGRLLAVGAPAAALASCAALGLAGSTMTAFSPTAQADTSACTPTLTGGTVPTSLTSAEQQQNAAAIVAAGVSLKVPTRGLVVAIATALQESGLRNLSGGDRDSVGLFQQRNAWGTFAERTNPTEAARMFFTGGHAGQPGLLDIHGWQGMTVTAAAQAVQVSAYPNAYAKWEPLATKVVAQLTGGGTTLTGGCTPTAGGAVPAAGGWTLPMPAGRYTITGVFGESRPGHIHAGVDFAAPTGTPVYAVTGGTMLGPGIDAGGWGCYLRIKHNDGGREVITLYAHLSREDVTAGPVRAGQQIGLSGGTPGTRCAGDATGPHLHFEYRPSGVPTDPIPWLKSHGLNP